MQLLSTTLLLAPLLAKLVSADCGGSLSYTTCDDRIVHWFNPETGEVCDPLDCGGGRAPVKYDVPGCAAYTGTEIYTSTRSILSCWTPSSASATTTASETTTESATATATSTADDEDDVATETKTLTKSTSTAVIPTTTQTPATTPAPTSPAASSSGAARPTGSGDGPVHTGAADLQTAAGAGSLVAAVAAIVGMVNLI